MIITVVGFGISDAAAAGLSVRALRLCFNE